MRARPHREAREALDPHAADARLLLFGTGFSPLLLRAAAEHGDVQGIDLPRLYGGD